MNTLDDLRTTLDRHAEDLDDTGRSVRPVAVHARIRAVRRRRAGIVATAAALALVGGVAAVSSLRSPGTPQPASVVGVDVPETIDVLGFPYVLDDTASLGDDDRHALSEVRGERAITLVGSGLGDGSATLLSDGEPVARVRSGDELAAPVPVGETRPLLEVRYDGTPSDARAGIAVYEATGELASGVSNGRAVFRETYAGQPLLGAAFSEAGGSSVTFRAGAARIARIALYCDGPGGLWVGVEVDGRPAVGSSCGADGSDATTGTSVTLDDLGPGEHEVAVRLTRGPRGPAVEDDGVTIGAGLYAVELSPTRLFGSTLEHRIEHAGRTWVSDSADTSPLTIETATEDLLLGAVSRGSVRLAWSGALGLGGSDGLIGGSGGGSLLAGVLLAGDTYEVRATGSDARILTYRPE